MASKSSIKSIDAALFSTGPFALSYADPDQRLLIRDHLISLLQDFPELKLSVDTFTYNNGTAVNLLCLNGQLQVSKFPSVPLTLWVHENYPVEPPMVFVNPAIPTHINHPFVDSSGSMEFSYLKMWKYPGCSILELTRRIVKIFKDDHRFADRSTCVAAHNPLPPSKLDALDGLARVIHHDLSTLMRNAEVEIENLWKLQAELRTRSRSLDLTIAEHKSEKRRLRDRVKNLQEGADELRKWRNVNDPPRFEAALRSLGAQNMFQGCDDEAETILDSHATDLAIEDLIDAMEKGMEEGVVSVVDYIKQIRTLAREQFQNKCR